MAVIGSVIDARVAAAQVGPPAAVEPEAHLDAAPAPPSEEGVGPARRRDLPRWISHESHRVAGYVVLAIHGAGGIAMLAAGIVTHAREAGSRTFLDGPTGGEGLIGSGSATLAVGLLVGLSLALCGDVRPDLASPGVAVLLPVRLASGPGDVGLSLLTDF